MRCQSCGEREASVVIKTMVSDSEQVVQLCAECANGYVGPGGVAITVQKIGGATAGAGEDLVCATCGKTFAEFSKTGLFGCPDCYEAFEPELGRLFRRVQGVSSHGQLAAGDDPLSDLAEELAAAVALEDFEEAARIRDHIDAVRSRASG